MIHNSFPIFSLNHSEHLDYPKRYRLIGSIEVQGSIRVLVEPSSEVGSYTSTKNNEVRK